MFEVGLGDTGRRSDLQTGEGRMNRETDRRQSVDCYTAEESSAGSRNRVNGRAVTSSVDGLSLIGQCLCVAAAL